MLLSEHMISIIFICYFADDAVTDWVRKGSVIKKLYIWNIQSNAGWPDDRGDGGAAEPGQQHGPLIHHKQGGAHQEARGWKFQEKKSKMLKNIFRYLSLYSFFLVFFVLESKRGEIICIEATVQLYSYNTQSQK